jgi:hypothetical protein
MGTNGSKRNKTEVKRKTCRTKRKYEEFERKQREIKGDNGK